MSAETPSEITLHIDSNHTSPYAMFAYIALKEKKLPHALKLINIREKHHKIAEYQSLSLTGKIPMLVHGDFALAESSAIIEYLDEAFPVPDYPRLLPQEIHQRARARQLQAWLRSDLLALRQDRPTTVIFDAPTDVPLTEAGQADTQKLLRVADSLIGENGAAIFGAWTIVDTELALMLNRLAANGDAVPDKLQRYVREQWARPSVQAWVQR